MNLLAIDTSTEACSAALLVADQIFSEFQIAERNHTQLIFPMLDSLLEQAKITLPQIDAFAFGRGPGSFTGVRLAVSLIQGMAFAMNKPVVPVSTLQAMAQRAIRLSSAKHVLVALDARMKEVYWCAYATDSSSIAQAMIDEQVVAPDLVEVPQHTHPWVAVGSGWDVYRQELASRISQNSVDFQAGYYPEAQDIAQLAQIAYDLGHAVKAEDALPVYLRDKVTN